MHLGATPLRQIRQIWSDERPEAFVNKAFGSTGPMVAAGISKRENHDFGGRCVIHCEQAGLPGITKQLF